MGLFFDNKPKTTTPTVAVSILPDVAKNEIMLGRLPTINSDKLFLKTGEVCHFIDKCLILKPKTQRNYRRSGISFPLFWGIRLNNGYIEPEEHEVNEEIRGVLYITNKRTIVQATKGGFDKSHTALSAIEPFSNAVELQYGETSRCIIVPEGKLVYMVYNLIRK